MTTDGVLGAAYLPTDGYIDPSQLTFALAEGARRGGAEIYQHTRVTEIPVEHGRVTGRRHRQGRDRGRGRRERRRHVRERDRRARRRERPDRPDGARVPDHQAVRPPDRHADDARPVAARLLPARVGRPDHGRLRAQPGAVVARRDSRGLQRQAARRGLAALRGADGERDRPGAVARRRRGRQADQRPRGLHARRRVHPRPDRGARPLDGRRLLRARARGRRRHGAARRRVDRRGHTVARHLAHGLAPLRPRVPLAATTRSPARSRSTRPTTT